MTVTTILTLSAFKVFGTLIVPVVATVALLALWSEPIDGDRW